MRPLEVETMRIRCHDCGHSEEVNVGLFVKILGAATAGFGFWAWVTFFFAGTGFALPICIAIVTGGAAMLTFKDEIVDWIINRGYPCEQCASQRWSAVSAEVEEEIKTQKIVIARLEKEAEDLRRDAAQKEREVFEAIKADHSSFSIDDVQELLDQDESQRVMIQVLQRDNAELAKQVESLREASAKVVRNIEKTLSACYPSLTFTGAALKRIVRLSESERLKIEVQFGYLQHNPQKAKFRDNIAGTDIKEIEFGDGGRFYVLKEGAQFRVVCVGNKNSQQSDIAKLRRSYA